MDVHVVVFTPYVRRDDVKNDEPGIGRREFW
jgi:hypothetical protein